MRRYEEDAGLGDHVENVKASNDIRVYLQNPDGIMAADKELEDQKALLDLKGWDVDVIALPETNRNWQMEWIRNKWKNQVKRVWPHAKVYYASIDKPAQTRANYVHGGVSLIVTNCWASRVMEHGSDYLGRWAWITLRGEQQEQMTVAVMYRPNPGTSTAGPTTVWLQQRTRLQEMALERDDTREVDPREKCLIDFKKWIENRRNNGEKLIVLTDANQALHEQTRAYSLHNLVTDCRLSSVMEDNHPTCTLRSLDRGSKTIDHIITAGVN